MTKIRKGNTLADTLANIKDENLILHIGCETGYFFIGTKSEFEKDYKAIETDTIAQYRKMVPVYTGQLKAYENQNVCEQLEIKSVHADTPEAYVSALIDQMEAYKKYIDSIKSKIDRINTLKHKLEIAIEISEHFTPLHERKVKDVYNRIQNDGVCIILEGYETGYYWYKHEYDDENGIRHGTKSRKRTKTS